MSEKQNVIYDISKGNVATKFRSGVTYDFITNYCLVCFERIFGRPL